MANNKITIKFEGFKDLIERIDKAGGSIENAIGEALNASADIVYNDMKKGIENHDYKHKHTWHTRDTLYKSEVINQGTNAYIKVGFKWDEGGFVAVYLNYGTPRNKPADPNILTKPISYKKKIKDIQKEIILKHLERTK